MGQLWAIRAVGKYTNVIAEAASISELLTFSAPGHDDEDSIIWILGQVESDL